MSSAGSSPAGVGGSPSILARALPSPLSGSYSWPSPTGFSSGDDDPLFRYVANLGPGVGTSTTPPVDNAPPAGTGTPSPARSAGRQSPVPPPPPQEDSVREIYLEEPPHHPDEVIWPVEEVRELDPVDRLEVENNPDEDWEDDRVAVGNNPDEVWDEEEAEAEVEEEEKVVVGHPLPRTKTTTRATPRPLVDDDLDA